MAISPVRLNHAVLFVADLDRSVRFYSDVFGMDVIAREPRANAAFLRLPRSGNHHDLGLFGVGHGRRPEASRRDRPVPPGLAARHHRRARRRPPDAARGRRLHRRIEPRRDQERLRRGSRRQRVRAHVDAPPRCSGAPTTNAAPIDHLDLAGEIKRWSGVRTAGPVTADAEEARA